MKTTAILRNGQRRSVRRRTVWLVVDPQPFPGWPRLEADLSAAADAGNDVKLSPVEILVVIGEHQRMQRRLDWATQIMRRVLAGDGCHGFQQGYPACEFREADAFVKGTPKRRWWRRSLKS
jgi:hypothetical protein